LRAALGPVGEVRVALGLALLDVKALALPPATRDDRHRMIALDPARWFAAASSTPTTIAIARGEQVGVSAATALIERWTDALAAWGVVTSVEPAPFALARTYLAAGIRDAHIPIATVAGEFGWMELAAGTITSLRRSRTASTSVPTTLPLGPWMPADESESTMPAWGAADGAARSWDDDAAGRLLPMRLGVRLAARARRRVWVAGAVAAAALLLFARAADDHRARRLAWLDSQVASARAAAGPAIARLDSIHRFDRESEVLVAARSTGEDPLEALAVLAERLPEDAVTQRVHVVGRVWTVEGSARSAASAMKALANEPRFVNVHLAGPSMRVTTAGEPRETFSLGFELR
jgi:hypothetical protein